MASITIVAGTALVNALAFSGTNAAFSMLGDHGSTERKRHDIAVEQLSRAREKWNRDRQQRLDLINKTLSDQRHAKQTFEDLDDAMRKYNKVTGHQHLLPLRDEPKLSDFYSPSRQQKDAELAVVVWAMTVVGLLAYSIK